jgi:hypothetical protein
MQELKDDDILEVKEPDTLSDDDIIEESQPGFLNRVIDKFTPSVETQETVKGLVDSGEDFSRGVARGLTLEGLDELGGAAGALVERGLGAVGIGPAAVNKQLQEQGFTGSGVEESLADTYKGYQEGINKELDMSAERSPLLTMGGQLAGGITSGVALGGALGLGSQGGKLKSITDIARDSGKSKAALELLKRGGANYAKAAPALAVESALTSEADLVGENAQPLEVAKDVAGGLTFAAPLMLGGQLVSDVAVPKAKDAFSKISDRLSQLASESPLARQAKIAYETYGKIGKVNPRSEKAILEGVDAIEGGTPFSQINTKRATDITNKILKADNELGRLVGESLDAATASGARVNAQDLVQDTFDQIVRVSEELPGVLQDANFNATMNKILKRNYTNASPREIKNAIDDITNSIDRIGNSRYPTPELEQAPALLRQLRKNLDIRLKESIPAYKDSAERFSQFRRAYMEQPIAGRLDPDLDDIMYGDLKKGQKKLVEAYEDLVSKTTADSQAVEDTEATFSKLAQTTKQFEAQELDRLQKGKAKNAVMPGADKFMQEIKDFADDASVRRATRKTQETQGGARVGIKDVTGLAQTGRGAVLTSSYLAGRAVSSKPGQKLASMGRNLYNAPADMLSELAQRMESNAGTAMFGKALREGLQNGDAAKKNAALFTIMQNPNARAFVEAETSDEAMDEE